MLKKKQGKNIYFLSKFELVPPRDSSLRSRMTAEGIFADKKENRAFARLNFQYFVVSSA